MMKKPTTDSSHTSLSSSRASFFSSSLSLRKNLQGLLQISRNMQKALKAELSAIQPSPSGPTEEEPSKNPTRSLTPQNKR
jgi:hypothetical protein